MNDQRGPIRITAPYNFVPLSRWIYSPPWSARVSQDLPFKEGVSGSLPITLTAHTPLLVGGEQRKAGQGPGEVFPFELPDKRYAIPGSSLKGMIRNVLEIAAFGKLRLADDRALSVRDLTKGARATYGKWLTDEVATHTWRPRAKAGRLSLGEGDAGPEWRITPCAYVRVQQEALVGWGKSLKIENCEAIKLRNKSLEAHKKYTLWGERLVVRFDLGPERDHDHSKRNQKGEMEELFLRYALATNLGSGDREGTLVFTGQPCDNNGGRGCKHMEFIFFDTAATSEPVSERMMRGFLQIHEASEDWRWWQPQLRRGRPVPVFYLEEEGRIASLGLAMMYRLPYRHTIGETIAHTHTDHRSDGRYDLAELMFGVVNDAEGAVDEPGPRRSLKGRVQFGLASALGQPQLERNVSVTLLNGPKPTYVPNYIAQSGEPPIKAWRDYNDPHAEVRGWKRYPVRPPELVQVQPLTDEQRRNRNVQVRLHPLAAGARFKAQVHFHNLRPEELGALLWALEWGGRPELRHALGMGKPFGFGQLSITVDAEGAELRANHGAPLPLGQYRQRFETEMERAYTEAQTGGGTPQSWRDCEQLRQVLAMADPAQAPRAPGGLSHLQLGTGKGNNEFLKAKKEGETLPPYVRSQARDDHALFPRPSPEPSPQATRSSAAPVRPPPAAGPVRSQPSARPQPPAAPVRRTPPPAGPARHPWVAARLAELATQHRTTEEDALRGKALAVAWSALPEGEEKAAVRENIIALWRVRGWWDSPTGKAAKQAKATYQPE